MATKLIANNFTSGSITADKLTVGALNPILTSVAICDASYNVLDDTAANTGGGYIQVTGTNFTTNSVVVINTTTATSTTYVNNTTLRAQVPAFAAASYPVYVIDTYDGSTAIRYNGITFSNTPIWGTGTTLSNQVANTAFGINVSANSDSSITYSNTTSLPTGTTLASNGYFSGTITIGTQTTYNFTVKANDVENQDASRTFSVTVTVPPPNLWMWGSNYAGTLGQNDVVYRSSPVQVGSGTTWNQINISESLSTAAIKTDGTLWTWGQNNYGQLGLNDQVNKSSPVQVGALTNWSQVSSADLNFVAIKTDGTLWTWGYNNAGQLGLSDVSNRSSPVQVGSGTTWSSIDGGSWTTIATKTDGTLWAWGSNDFGQLGQNDRVYRSSPVQVGSGTTWSKISIDGGYCHVAATKTDGTLWLWGDNSYGALGLNSTAVPRSSPVQVAGTTWSQISVSQYHTIATKTDGTLWGWGRNTQGTLGLNVTSSRSSPTQIGSGTTWSLVSIGTYTTAATKTDGTLWAWGQNNRGQLGLNDQVNKSSPTQIGTGTTWTLVKVSQSAVIARTT
jgi:alpha-tubulin suppressor-like RCC1 family protein